MYVVTVVFEVYPDQARRFLARVRQQAEESLAREEGCHRFDVCKDPEAETRVFLYEIYDHRAAFEAHLASPHYASFDREASTMIRAKSVEFWELA